MASTSADRRVVGASSAAASSSSSVLPPIYELHAPSWRPRLHPGSQNLGWPDVYPPKLGQGEDALTESAVKNGVGGRSAVSNETYSAHDMIYDRLNGTQVTSQLGSLFHEVVERRKQLAKIHCGPGPLHHRAPQRVTLNEAKLAAYIKELADPSVPLRKIARSVPHGYRGERMLDMLWNGGSAPPVLAAARSQQSASNYASPAPAATTPGASTSAGANANDKTHPGLPRSIAIDRAVWFVRVVGSSEIASTRARQGSSATYTAEWTTLFFNWLRRQIVELNIIYPHAPSANPASPHPSARLPGTPRAMHLSSQTRDAPYSLFLEEDFRMRWLAKWDYSIALLRAIAREGLLDLHVAARTSLEMLRHANRAQIHFVLVLVHELICAITTSTMLSCHASEVVCHKLQDLRKIPDGGSALDSLCADLQKLLGHLFVNNPDAFVSIKVWPLAEPLLIAERVNESHEKQFAQIQRRNDCLRRSFLRLDRSTGDAASSRSEQQLNDIAVLDGMCVLYDVPAAASKLFSRSRSTGEALKDIVTTILIWATTTWRVGKHRPFAAASLLQLLSSQYASSKAKARSDIDAAVFSFLSEADSSMRLENATQKSSAQLALSSVSVTSIAVLLGELGRSGCFSFPKYLQRLTARGMTAGSGRETKRKESTEATVASDTKMNGTAHDDGSYDSLHARLLRSVPVAKGTPAFESQRRTAIYGNRSKETWEEAMERRATRELLSALPWLSSDACAINGTAPDEADESSTPTDMKLERFWSSSRFVRFRVTQNVIQPRISDPAWRATCLTPARLVCLAHILAGAEEFGTLYPLLIDAIADASSSIGLVQTAGDIANMFRIIWSAMSLASPTEMQKLVAPAKTNGSTAIDEKEAGPIMLPSLDQVKASAVHYVRSVDEGTPIETAILSLGQSDKGRAFVLEASVEALQEADGDASHRICSWLSKVCETCSSSDGVLTDEFNSLLTNIRDQQCYGFLCKLAMPLIAKRLLHHKSVFVNGISPQLILGELKASASNEDSVLSSALQLAHELLRARELKTPEDAIICAGRSTLQYSNHLKPLLALMQRLCESEQDGSLPGNILEAIRVLLDDLASLEGVKIAFQGTFAEATKAFCAGTSKDLADKYLADFLPTLDATSSHGIPEDSLEGLVSTYNVWHHPAFTLRLVLHLQTLEQHRQSGVEDGSNRMLRTARLTTERLSQESPDRILALVSSLSDLAPQASRAFTAALVDERLKRLCHLLTLPDAVPDVLLDLVKGLVKMTSEIGDDPLVASPSAVQAFGIVQAWLEDTCRPLGSLSRTEVQSNGAIDSNPAQSATLASDADAIYIRCGILCLLMRMEELFTVATIKAQAPKLFTSLLCWTLHNATKADTCEEDIVPVLDTAQNILQLAPVEVQGAVQQSGFESIAAVVQSRSCPFDAISKRLLRLCGTHGNTGSVADGTLPTRTPLVEATSFAAALVNGQFTPAPAKPWDWHPNPDTMKGEPDAHAANLAAQSTTEFSALANNGPLSLSLFGAHKTLDRLPHADATMRGGPFLNTDLNDDEREQWRRLDAMTGASFGMHMGGSSAWSRDILHGYSVPSATDEGEADEDYSNLSIAQVRRYVPALAKHLAKMDDIKRAEAAKALAARIAREDAERNEQLERAQREKREEARLKAQDRKRKRQESAASTNKTKAADDAASKRQQGVDAKAAAAAATSNGKKRKGSTTGAQADPAPAATSAAKGKAASKTAAATATAATATTAAGRKRPKKGQE